MEDQKRQKVFEQVRRWPRDLVGGSGHLASYHIREDTFELAAARVLGNGCTQHAYTARAFLETEFTPSDGRDPSEEAIEGTIVLD